MHVRPLLVLLWVLAPILTIAQPSNERGVLRGFVSDSSTGESIPYVTLIVEGSNLRTSSNASGYFAIPDIPPGRYVLTISHVSYIHTRVPFSIRSGGITELAIKLEPGVIESEEAIVIGRRPPRPNEADLGLERLTARDIKMIVKGVEADIFRALQFLPGVSTTSDVSSRYYVRGGGSDQNLVLLNGATIYNPFHTLGIFSVIDPEMVSALEFHKGGFPPEYGGRLSSVLTMVTREGNQNSFGGSVQAGLLSGKASFEGPIPDGSFLITGRKSWYAQIMRRYLPQNQAPFDFYDLFGKVTYQNEAIDSRSRFTLFGFLSDDNVRNDSPFLSDYTVANEVMGLNWHKVWSSPLYSILTLSSSGFDASLEPKKSSSQPRRNSIRDVTVNLDFTYIYDSRDELAFGWQNTALRTELDLTNVLGNHYTFRQHGWDMNAYLNYKFYRWKDFGATVGVRIKFLALSEHRPGLFEPRISLTYRPNPVLALKAAFGFYSQEVVTLTDENELVSVFEPWIITPDYINSPIAAHMSLGAKAYITDRFTLEVEGYYKPIQDLVDVNERKFVTSDRDFVSVEGNSYGLECMLIYEPGWMTFQSSYSLSWTNKIKNGEWYAPRYDSRHTLSAFAGFKAGGGWEISVTWVLRTGMPFTPIAGFYDVLTGDGGLPWYFPSQFESTILWGRRNSARLPVYHRLDIGIAKGFRLWGLELTVEGSIVNVYNRKNIFYFDRDNGEATYMLPIFPALSLKAVL